MSSRFSCEKLNHLAMNVIKKITVTCLGKYNSIFPVPFVYIASPVDVHQLWGLNVMPTS